MLPGCLSRLQKGLGGAVKVSESLWTLEDGTLHIQLTKAEEGATWDSAIAGALPLTRPCAVPSPAALIGAAMENQRPVPDLPLVQVTSCRRISGRPIRSASSWSASKQRWGDAAGELGAAVFAAAAGLHGSLWHPMCSSFSLTLSPVPAAALQHPGFDFSSAEFSGGAVPDPRTFMRDPNQQ